MSAAIAPRRPGLAEDNNQRSPILDTGPLVALGDAADTRHSDIRRILTEAPDELVIPAPVTAEVDYLVRRRGGAMAARLFLEDIGAGRFRVMREIFER